MRPAIHRGLSLEQHVQIEGCGESRSVDDVAPEQTGQLVHERWHRDTRSLDAQSPPVRRTRHQGVIARRRLPGIRSRRRISVIGPSRATARLGRRKPDSAFGRVKKINRRVSISFLSLLLFLVFLLWFLFLLLFFG